MKILFVCTGNICRSPSAEGVLRHRLAAHGLADIMVDSAGTHSYHEGEPPDTRSISAAKKRGVCIRHLRGRKVKTHDFHEFDLILALDEGHLDHLSRLKPKNSPSKVELFLKYANIAEKTEVPDPYYGNSRDFEEVLDLIEAGCDALVAKIKENRQAI